MINTLTNNSIDGVNLPTSNLSKMFEQTSLDQFKLKNNQKLNHQDTNISLRLKS